MTIIEKIINFKKQEVAKIKSEIPVKNLVKSPMFKRSSISLKKSLMEVNSTGVLAEFKRKSPLVIFNETATITDVVNGYLDTKVAGVSIVTDTPFFGGTMADLMEARAFNQIKPILRKDFILDGFQIVESKAIGADAVSLIASLLTKEQLKNYGQLALDLGLEVLYEVHRIEDLDKINDLEGKIISVNNKDLNTFKVDLETSVSLVRQLSENCVKISEGGITSPGIVTGLKEYGFHGFVVGDHFMKSEKPGEVCKEFIDQIV